MKSVKNLLNNRVHSVNDNKYGYTVCGLIYEGRGFTPPREVNKLFPINCKSCMNKIN